MFIYILFDTHKCFHELVEVEHAVGTFYTRHLIVGLYVVGLNTKIPNEERYWLLDVSAGLNGRWMVGEHRNAHGFIPCAHLFEDGFHDASVEIVDGAQFQFQITIMPSLITGFEM